MNHPKVEIQTRSDIWITENHGNFLRQSYRVKEVLFSGRSQFQTIDIVDTYGHGKMLFNDGLVMISERDEFIYHEMIVHVPLRVHPDPRRVLVIGGGDGGTAREVLKYKSVEKCVMVEIDEMVIDACKKHIPVTSSCLTNNPRLELRIEDAVKYVAESSEEFDVILVDSTDPIGPAQPLFGEEFYRNVNHRLSGHGIVVSQGESPHYESKIQKSMLKILKNLFPVIQIYNFSNLTYPGGLWSFTFASKGLHPIRDMREKSFSEMECSYYNSEIHKAAFCHPSFMKNQLGEILTY